MLRCNSKLCSCQNPAAAKILQLPLWLRFRQTYAGCLLTGKIWRLHHELSITAFSNNEDSLISLHAFKTQIAWAFQRPLCMQCRKIWRSFHFSCRKAASSCQASWGWQKPWTRAEEKSCGSSLLEFWMMPYIPPAAPATVITVPSTTCTKSGFHESQSVFKSGPAGKMDVHCLRVALLIEHHEQQFWRHLHFTHSQFSFNFSICEAACSIDCHSIWQ